jgi:hypothetical protein
MDAYGALFGNDNDDWHKICPTRSLHGPSEEDNNELHKDAPSFSAWKVPREQHVKVTIDLAQEQSMKQLAREVNFIDSKLTDKFGSRQPHFEELLDEFFGERSEIYKVFEKHLPNFNFERYSPWLMTMFVCLAYGKSIEDLYSEYSFIDKCGLASPEKGQISVEGHIHGMFGPKARQDVKPFWLHIQDAINGVLHEWCIEGFDDGTREKKCVVDDDKLHQCQSQKGKTCI